MAEHHTSPISKTEPITHIPMTKLVLDLFHTAKALNLPVPIVISTLQPMLRKLLALERLLQLFVYSYSVGHCSGFPLLCQIVCRLIITAETVVPKSENRLVHAAVAKNISP